MWENIVCSLHHILATLTSYHFIWQFPAPSNSYQHLASAKFTGYFFIHKELSSNSFSPTTTRAKIRYYQRVTSFNIHAITPKSSPTLCQTLLYFSQRMNSVKGGISSYRHYGIGSYIQNAKIIFIFKRFLQSKGLT